MAAKGQFLQRFGTRAWPVLAAVGGVLVVALLAPPALAQFGTQFNRRPSGMFDSFWGPYQGFRSNEPRVDASRAPAPRKAETAPTTSILVLGDSMADWLAYGLEDALADMPELGVVRKHRTNSGLIRYDTRSETSDWAQAAREAIAATKPKYIVMMVGLNDRQPIRVRQSSAAAPAAGATTPQPPASGDPATGAHNNNDPAETPAPETPSIVAPETSTRTVYHVYEFRSDQWAEHYTKRIDLTMAALKAANVPVLWVGLPSIRGPKSTSDMQYLDDLYRERAEKAGITYIDVWDGFVDDAGRFTPQGPDFEGQIRRLRVNDGVHFTKAGARKLAHYVERELRRVMTRGLTTVALPTSEPQTQTPTARPGQPTQRPLSGPVLPLTTAATGQQDLVGGGAPIAPPTQAIAVRVLQRGEALAAPAGRSDDFAWPRRDIAPFGADPVVATTTDPVLIMQAAPTATSVPIPNEETRAVAANAQRKTTGRAPSQQQQRRTTNSFFGGFFR